MKLIEKDLFVEVCMNKCRSNNIVSDDMTLIDDCGSAGCEWVYIHALWWWTKAAGTEEGQHWVQTDVCPDTAVYTGGPSGGRK